LADENTSYDVFSAQNLIRYFVKSSGLNLASFVSFFKVNPESFPRYA